MDDLQLKLILEAQDKLSRVITGVVNNAERNFNKLESKLKNVSASLDDFGNKFTALGAGFTATGVLAAKAFDLTSSFNEIVDFEHELRSLGNTGGLSDEKLKKLGKQIRQVGVETNNTNKNVLEGINTLVAAGMNPERAIGFMTAIGKTATSQGAEINDIAKTTFALADNMKIPLSEIDYALNVLTAAGKEGRFELKNMAMSFPELTSGAAAFGMTGVKSVASLSAALQIAMKGAGTEAEAATNFSRFLSTIKSSSTQGEVQKVWGISIEKIIKNAIKNGEDPIMELMKVIDKKTGGDPFKIAQAFHDKTAVDFITPMLQNLNEYKRIKGATLNSGNVIEKDYAKMMTTTAEQWKAVTNKLKNMAFEKLEKPLSVVNSVLTKINSNPSMQKGLFNAIIGTVALGTLTTGIGLTSKLFGVATNGYANIVSATAKNLPMLTTTTLNLIDKVGGHSLSHTLKWTSEVAKNGNKLGLNLGKQIFLSIGADSQRTRKNIINGIINPIKAIPKNSKIAGKALKDFITNIPTNTMSGFKNGLTAVQMGFLNFIPNCKKAVGAIRLFSSAVFLNPVGLAITGIAVGAFLIYKYWKPIAAFFKGTFRGIKEGLAPLKPVFTQIGNAIKPLINGIKKFFSPINTEGKKAEAFGYKFGKGIAWAIKKVVEAVNWVKNLLTLGGRIKFGNRSAITLTEVNKPDGSHANGLSNVPFDGYIAETHKGESILTAKEAKEWQKYKQGNGTNTNTTIHYAPVVTISGEGDVTNKVLKILQTHANKIAEAVDNVNRRKRAGAYA